MIILLYKLVGYYSWVLVIYAISSWIPELRYSKLGDVLARLSEPFLQLFRGLPLQIYGLDLTILVAYGALRLIQRFLLILL